MCCTLSSPRDVSSHLEPSKERSSHLEAATRSSAPWRGAAYDEMELNAHWPGLRDGSREFPGEVQQAASGVTAPGPAAVQGESICF